MKCFGCFCNIFSSKKNDLSKIVISICIKHENPFFRETQPYEQIKTIYYSLVNKVTNKYSGIYFVVNNLHVMVIINNTMCAILFCIEINNDIKRMDIGNPIIGIHVGYPKYDITNNKYRGSVISMTEIIMYSAQNNYNICSSKYYIEKLLEYFNNVMKKKYIKHNDNYSLIIDEYKILIKFLQNNIYAIISENYKNDIIWKDVKLQNVQSIVEIINVNNNYKHIN